MSSSELRAIADQRFEEALTRSSARDPRDFYRDRLRSLRAEQPELYEQAVAYFEGTLIPAVATTGADPIAEWLEYGRFVATLMSAGRTVQIDRTGLARDFDRERAAGELILHIPATARDPVQVIGLPVDLSAAQRATFELLVKGSPR